MRHNGAWLIVSVWWAGHFQLCIILTILPSYILRNERILMVLFLKPAFSQPNNGLNLPEGKIMSTTGLLRSSRWITAISCRRFYVITFPSLRILDYTVQAHPWGDTVSFICMCTNLKRAFTMTAALMYAAYGCERAWVCFVSPCALDVESLHLMCMFAKLATPRKRQWAVSQHSHGRHEEDRC